jgi:hypothetical protein
VCEDGVASAVRPFQPPLTVSKNWERWINWNVFHAISLGVGKKETHGVRGLNRLVSVPEDHAGGVPLFASYERRKGGVPNDLR